MSSDSRRGKWDRFKRQQRAATANYYPVDKKARNKKKWVYQEPNKHQNKPHAYWILKLILPEDVHLSVWQRKKGTIRCLGSENPLSWFTKQPVSVVKTHIKSNQMKAIWYKFQNYPQKGMWNKIRELQESENKEQDIPITFQPLSLTPISL
jgi:hypothetical protein